MKNIILIAPPAAGKGTQSKLLSSKYQIPHISTGDLLRSASLKNDEMGNLIKHILETGQLVSDDIVIKLLSDTIVGEECKNGYILDGFPRTVNQAKEYVKLLAELNFPLGDVIYLDIPKEVVKKRIVGRLSCSKCKAVYNNYIDALKSKQEGLCDVCSSNLVKRSDDNEQTFNDRYDVFMEYTYPLLEFFKDNLKIVKGDLSSLETFEEIVRVIND